ncbi:hypothetical protein LLH00_12050 [bacterium]|nr:hypothetical protein [bacterium]
MLYCPKRTRRSRRVALYAALLTAVLFCLPWAKNALCAQTVKVERSARSRPDWVTRVPESDRRWMYFVGRASGEASLEAAEQDAAADAVAQAVAAAGLSAAFSYERLRSEAGFLLQDRLVLSGVARLEGLKRLETWYEKTTRQDAGGRKTAYEAHLLVRLPQDALEKARMKLEQESSERISRAESLLDQGKRMEHEGDIHSALSLYREALEHLGGPSQAYLPEPSRRDELARELGGAAFHSGLELRTLVLRFDSSDSGPFPEVLRQTLYSSILLEGFSPLTDSAAGAAALPRLRAECVRAGVTALEDGFKVCLWNLSLQLSSPVSGEMVASFDYTAKGFGPDETRATQDGLRKIRLETLPRFARELRERLDLTLGPAPAAGDKFFFAR